MKDNLEKLTIIEKATAKISSLASFILQDYYENLLANVDIQRCNATFISYRTKLEIRKGNLCNIWMSMVYLQFIQRIMLTLLIVWL